MERDLFGNRKWLAFDDVPLLVEPKTVKRPSLDEQQMAVGPEHCGRVGLHESRRFTSRDVGGVQAAVLPLCEEQDVPSVR